MPRRSLSGYAAVRNRYEVVGKLCENTGCAVPLCSNPISLVYCGGGAATIAFISVSLSWTLLHTAEIADCKAKKEWWNIVLVEHESFVSQCVIKTPTMFWRRAKVGSSHKYAAVNRIAKTQNIHSMVDIQDNTSP